MIDHAAENLHNFSKLIFSCT